MKQETLTVRYTRRKHLLKNTPKQGIPLTICYEHIHSEEIQMKTLRNFLAFLLSLEIFTEYWKKQQQDKI